MTKGCLIGLVGPARSGKDTVADYLVKNHGFIKLSFADPLKMACGCVFSLSHEQMYGDKKSEIDPYWGKTPREMLQFVGTDLFRNHFDQNIWVKSLERRIQIMPDPKRIVLADCRFKNEKEAVERWGGKTWRLIRTDGPGANGGIALHPSEEELKTIPLDSFAEVISLATGVPELLAEAEARIKKYL